MGLTNLMSVKYLALALLVLQNTFLVVFMRMSRVIHGPMYAASTAVFTMELVKFISCNVVVFAESWNRGRGINGYTQSLIEDVSSKPYELAKLAVPSVLYVLQNNLLYYALSHLDAATFQVGYQVKILTTAFFSMSMLGKVLTRLQWLSLIILTIGVSLAQLSSQESKESNENTLAGFIAVLAAACTSGFSGVWFEKILKGSTTTLWMRNIQMGLSSLVLAFAGVYLSSDRQSVLENGFFYGYTTIVWAVIMLQAIGGLVVAVVVKYADNILKGFAASFSIITSLVMCYIMFDFHPNATFMLGAILVNVSMYMYGYVPAPKETRQSLFVGKSDVEQV